MGKPPPRLRNLAIDNGSSIDVDLDPVKQIDGRRERLTDCPEMKLPSWLARKT